MTSTRTRFTQDQLFDLYLTPAAENFVDLGYLSSPEAEDFGRVTLVSRFHRFTASLGAPFSDSAEAAEVAFDAVASVVAGLSWQTWLDSPSHVIGKQGTRGEALVLIAAMDAVGSDAAAVSGWYRSRSADFDDAAYDLGPLAGPAMDRIRELSTVAANRAAGELFALIEE